MGQREVLVKHATTSKCLESVNEECNAHEDCTEERPGSPGARYVHLVARSRRLFVGAHGRSVVALFLADPDLPVVDVKESESDGEDGSADPLADNRGVSSGLWRIYVEFELSSLFVLLERVTIFDSVHPLFKLI